MSRGLRLLALVAAVVVAGCGGNVGRSGGGATAGQGASVAAQESFILYAKAKRAQFINHADDRDSREQDEPVRADSAADTSERQLREERRAGRRQRARSASRCTSTGS